MNTINVALIGVSGFASTHYEEVLEWHGKGRVRLVAVTIINQSQEPEKTAHLRQLDCEIFTDYNEMLARWDQKLDLCIIPTGIHLHSPMALAALHAGCNVLLEKPVAATIQEVNALEAAAEKAGKFIAVGFQHMYTPEVAAMKKAILDGLLGDIECIKCKGLWPRATSYYQRNNWAGRLSVEGHWVLDSPFSNAFAHWLNLLCFFAGSKLRDAAVPKSIEAELYKTYPIESADTACLHIATEEGIPLFFWVSHSCIDPINPILEIRGSKGSLVWTIHNVLFRNGDCETVFMPTASQTEGKHLMYTAIIDKLQGGDAFICNLSIARNQTLCTNGAFEVSTIHPMDQRFLTIQDKDGDAQTEILGVADTFNKAFAEEKLWSEMGVEWANKPSIATLEHYTEFKSLAKACAD